MIILLRSLLEFHIFQTQAGFPLQFGIEVLYVPINISYQGQTRNSIACCNKENLDFSK